jgi:D-alanyl-lipoteichoic acid acyltransferase DltB (MBOAT superfamily)
MAFVPKYLLIILATIVIDYAAGLLMVQFNNPIRRWLLILSICANVGILAIFKYYNFLNANLNVLYDLLHIHNPLPVMTMVLPIGLSFHTFQAMSYTIEVYKGRQKPERHFGIYALYVLFYPQMVAGPIERPQNLLHQFHEAHQFNWDNFKYAFYLMLRGFFKKVVIADRLAYVVDYSYTHTATQNGLSTLLAVVFYSFQIYCDFSGYSDIAKGAAGIMGFRLMKNFDSPYMSLSVNEFWRRWHISLSSWFRDYLYIPLGGNRVSRGRWILNIFITFGLSGLWHGASWPFVIWGVMHGLGIVAERVWRPVGNRIKSAISVPFFNILAAIWTFGYVTLAWIFFRAGTFDTAFKICRNLTHIRVHDTLQTGLHVNEIIFCFLLITGLLLTEHYKPRLHIRHNWVFWGYALATIGCIFFFGIFNQHQFIYFQF